MVIFVPAVKAEEGIDLSSTSVFGLLPFSGELSLKDTYTSILSVS
jgi:hypothetical protein